MGNGFVLLDLPSQATAVQRLLRGHSIDEKLAWLDAHGRLRSLPIPQPKARPVYLFESGIGQRCVFFIDGDTLVFLGDHSTYTINE